MSKIAFTVERIVEDINCNPKRRTTKAYTLEGTKDDVLEWFEDTYRDDSPVEKGLEPNTYWLSKATATGYINYKLTIKG